MLLVLYWGILLNLAEESFWTYFVFTEEWFWSSTSGIGITKNFHSKPDLKKTIVMYLRDEFIWKMRVGRRKS